MKIIEVIKEERNQYTGKKRLSVSDRVNAIQQRLNSIPKNERTDWDDFSVLLLKKVIRDTELENAREEISSLLSMYGKFYDHEQQKFIKKRDIMKRMT